MDFLSKILSRPSNEKPFMILITGYPDEDALVPIINKKTLKDDVMSLTDKDGLYDSALCAVYNSWGSE